jgi:hypothetical protein
MIFGMPRKTFYFTVVFALLLFVPAVTDMPDKVRFWWALFGWIALSLSTFVLIRNSEISSRRLRLAASFLIPVGILVFAFCLLRPQWGKAYPTSVAASADVADETSRIEHLLGPVQDAGYRQLVASVIHAFDPHATISVGSLVDTPDGIRTVDIEVRSSSKDGAPFLTAIDIVDLPSGDKADITYVDAADSKRTDIKANAMLLCSNTGFEPDAISKAKRRKIGLISVLRQGDQRVKAIIEEEIYLRKVQLDPFSATFNGNNFQLLNGWAPAYNGGLITDWLELEADLMAGLNPELTFQVKKDFNFKKPIYIYKDGKQITLTSMSVSFTPHVQWLSQTIQLDAKAGIYDYVRGRVRLAPGSNSYTISGIDFNHAKPLLFVPSFAELGVGLKPGELDFALSDISPGPLPGTNIPHLDDLIRPEDLRLKLTDSELRSLKKRAQR